MRKKTMSILLALFVVITTIAYSALATSLAITSEAKFRVQADIRLTGISLESTNNATVQYESNYSKNTITSGFILPTVDSSITYKITVKNNGLIDQTIYDLIIKSTNNDGLTFEITDYKIKDIIGYKTEETFYITYRTTNPSNEVINVINYFDFRKVYKVTYETYDGTNVNEQIKYEDEDLILTSDEPLKENYSFNGWTDEENGTTVKYNGGDKYTLNKSIILYAVYEINTVKVTFNPNATDAQISITSKDIKIGSEYGVLPTPTRKGYNFTGWYTESENGEKVESTTIVTKTTDHSLYGNWEEKTYTIEYDCDGGTGTPSSQTTKYNETFTTSTGKCTKEGYLFKGWYDPTDVSWTSWTGTWKYDNGQYGIENNKLILTAKYLKLISIPTNEYCKNNLIYTGDKQTLTNTEGEGYTFNDNTGTNAGEYTVTAKLNSGYAWSDNTLTNKSFTCSIGKAYPTISLSSSTGSATVGKTSKFTESANVEGNFENTVNNSNSEVSPSSFTDVTANTEKEVTVSATSVGSSIIIVSFTPSDTTNYYTASRTYVFNSTAIRIYVRFRSNSSNINDLNVLNISENGSGVCEVRNDEYILDTTTYARDIVCYCDTTGSNRTCSITSPSITAANNTPTVIGYSTGATSRTNSWSPSETKVVDGSISQYYAQTKSEAKTYTVNYDKGSNVSSISKSSDSCDIAETYNGTEQASSCSVTSPTITGNKGYETIGWNETKDSLVSTINENTSYNLNATNNGKKYYGNVKAKTYIVKYNCNGGSETYADQTVTYGETFSTITDICTKTGYTFKGWYDSTNGNWTSWTGTWTYDNGQYGIENNILTLKAKWEANKYKVYFNGHGGTQLQNSNLVAKYDGLYNNYNSHDNVESWIDLSGKNKNGTVYNGTWGEDYLEFNGTDTWVNLGEINSDYNTLEVTFSADSTKKQHILGNLESGGNGIIISEGKIKAQYAINSYDSGYQVVNSKINVEVGKKYHVVSTYDGTTLKLYVDGVLTNSIEVSGTIYKPDDSTVMVIGANPDGSTATQDYFKGKIYNAAIYKSALTEEQIKNDSLKTVTYDESYGDLPTAARKGYTFNGWYTAITGGEKVESTTKVTTASDHNLYARWTPNTYTVTYDCNGGNETYEDQTATYGETFSTITNTCTKKGYTFKGWYDPTDESWTSWTGIWKYDNGKYGIENNTLTLKAKWEVNTYTVKYDCAGGNETYEDQTITYGDNFTTNTGTCTKTGYTFNGWMDPLGNPSWTSWSGTWKFDNGEYGIENNVLTLTAKYTINTYTLTVNPNGGTWSNSTDNQTFTQNYGTTKTIANPTRDGYTFKGWVLTKEIDGSNYVELMYQAPANAGFNDEAGAKSANSLYLYSQLGQLEYFKYNDKYEFIILPDENLKIYHWTQTSNPLTTTAITGYTNISNGMGGLVYNNSKTLLARTSSSNDWWSAIGMYDSRGCPISSSDNLWTYRPIHFYVKAADDLSNLSSYTITGALDSNNNYIFRNENITLQAVWADETAPVCTWSTLSSVTYDSTATLTLSCTDTGSKIDSQTLTTSNFTSSDTTYGTITNVSAPTAITNGYKYTVTVKGVKADGTFNVSLNASSIADKSGNKNIATTSSNITVNKATLSGSVKITGTNTYGNILTASVTNTNSASISYQWYYNSSNSTSGGTAISGETSGTYTIGSGMTGKYIYVVVTATKDNYNNATWTDITDASTNNTTLVAKRALTITAVDQTVTYGTAITKTVAKVSVTAGSLARNDAISAITLTQSTTNVTTNGTITPSAATIKKSSSTDVTSNYNITYATGTLTITQAKPTITLAATSKALTYPTAGTVTYTYDGDGTVSCTSGDTSYVTCSVNTSTKTITLTPVKPTSSAITVTIKGAAGTNYSAADNKTISVTVANGTLSGSVKITGTNTYGNTLTASVTNTNSASVSYQWYYNSNNSSSGGTAISGATSNTYTIGNGLIGKYIYVAVTATKDYYNNATWTDITDASTNTTATVAKRAITIKAANQTVTYGTAITKTVAKVSVSSGSLASNDAISAITLTQSTTNATTNGLISPSAATIKKSSSTDVTSNYDITYETGSLTINKKSVTAPTAANYCESRTYTASSQTLTKTAGEGYSFSNNTGTNAGNYTVTATLGSNYTWSDGTTTSTKTFTCTIAQATPTLTLSATSGSANVGGTTTFTEKASVKGKFANSSSSTTYATVSPAEYSDIAANTAKTVTITGKSIGSATITVTFTPSDTTNYKSVSKTYSFTATANTFKVYFNANGNTINATEKSCTTTGSNTTCTVTTPTITAPTNTPSICGFKKGSSTGTTSCDVGSNSSLTLSSSNNGATYYAQTYKSSVTRKITYSKGSNVSAIGKTSDSCTIAATYNGTAQGNSCDITTTTITPAAGYMVIGWISSDSSFLIKEGVTTSLTSDMTLYTSVVRLLCKRATTLHTETCTTTGNSYPNCSANGYTTGSTITYGQVGTKGTLSVGDAFDCDINNDGTYDATNERFYYLHTTDNRAVLILFSNYKTNALDNSTTGVYWASSNTAKTPSIAFTFLPSTTQWSGFTLSSTSVGSCESSSVTCTNYSVSGKAARLLEIGELKKACSITNYTQATLPSKCHFLMENTHFGQASSSRANGYWISAYYGNYGMAIDPSISGAYNYNHGRIKATNALGIRPVIEVPLSQMSY